MRKIVCFLLFCSAAFAGEILEVTQENYNEITEATLPVIMDVNATWCNPCQRMNLILKELSEKYQGTIQFATIDFDSQSELAKQYGVTALPTILFIKPGHETPVMKYVGFLSKKNFETKIAEFLKK